jgi:type II secretory pathway pseudopilin PulG
MWHTGLLRKSPHRQQAGDTIVEVLISIVIIATILTGSFMLARNSSEHVRDAEEHGQALNLLQGQVEQLRTAAVKSGDPLRDYLDGNDFCFAKDGSGRILTAHCDNFGDNSLYTIAIKQSGYKQQIKQIYTFQATVTWQSVSGDNAQEQLFYRIQLGSS